MIKALDACVLDCNDERRGRSAATTQKSRFIIADKETNDGKGRNVNHSLRNECETGARIHLKSKTYDTPESSLDGGRHGGARVGSLRSSQSNQLRTSWGWIYQFHFNRTESSKILTEGEGSGDEHSADTLEAIGKCTRIPPFRSTNIMVISTSARATTANANTERRIRDMFNPIIGK